LEKLLLKTFESEKKRSQKIKSRATVSKLKSKNYLSGFFYHCQKAMKNRTKTSVVKICGKKGFNPNFGKFFVELLALSSD